jgi:hypothetical protein
VIRASASRKSTTTTAAAAAAAAASVAVAVAVAVVVVVAAVAASPRSGGGGGGDANGVGEGERGLVFGESRIEQRSSLDHERVAQSSPALSFVLSPCLSSCLSSLSRRFPAPLRRGTRPSGPMPFSRSGLHGFSLFPPIITPSER